jgi:hypothetical protein
VTAFSPTSSSRLSRLSSRISGESAIVLRRAATLLPQRTHNLPTNLRVYESRIGADHDFWQALLPRLSIVFEVLSTKPVFVFGMEQIELCPTENCRERFPAIGTSSNGDSHSHEPVPIVPPARTAQGCCWSPVHIDITCYIITTAKWGQVLTFIVSSRPVNVGRRN